MAHRSKFLSEAIERMQASMGEARCLIEDSRRLRVASRLLVARVQASREREDMTDRCIPDCIRRHRPMKQWLHPSSVDAASIRAPNARLDRPLPTSTGVSVNWGQ